MVVCVLVAGYGGFIFPRGWVSCIYSMMAGLWAWQRTRELMEMILTKI